MKFLKFILVVLFLILAVGRISLFLSKNPIKSKPTNSFDPKYKREVFPSNNILYSIFIHKDDIIIAEVVFPDIGTYEVSAFNSEAVFWSEEGKYTIINADKDNKARIIFTPESKKNTNIPNIEGIISSNSLITFCNVHQSRVSSPINTSSVETQALRNTVFLQKDSLLHIQDESRRNSECNILYLPSISKSQ
jgi:hypothetical protein